MDKFTKSLQGLAVTEDFDAAMLSRITLLAADLDKTLYPNGMGNATTEPKPEAKLEWQENIRAYMDFKGHNLLAIPVTGNSPALAQQKFNRSGREWVVQENPGVFCNGALDLGVNGVVEYSAAVGEEIMKGIQNWAADGSGFIEVAGVKYPFCVNCMTKSQVLWLPPKDRNPESKAIADNWASMQLMASDIPDSEHSWAADPAYQVNLLLKSRAELSAEFPAWAEDFAKEVGNIQTALLDDLEKCIGKISDYGYQGKHVIQPWVETNILKSGVNKGQSLNRFIHCESVRAQLGEIDVGLNVMVAGDAANDLPMFVEWGEVEDFNGKKLFQTAKPPVRVIMPDAEDVNLAAASNVRNKVFETLDAVVAARTRKSQ